MRLSEWNEALFSDLRDRARPERRLYLYVDRETLADVSALNEAEAVEDFCAAFRAARTSRPFSAGAEAADRWASRGFEGVPPFVADLAMTVLAVTEEPVGAQHGVYRTQNSLLGLPPEAHAPPGYGDDVPAMWETWNRWLRGPGRAFGLPSARTFRTWATLQGWSRSQGLVRHRDRLTIEQFVEERSPGLRRLDVDDLLVWMRYRGAACADFLARVEHDEAALEVVQDVLDDEAARWSRDGARERKGRAMRGLLLYDDWSHVIQGAVHVDPALIGQTVSVGDGETVTVDEHTPTLRVDIAGVPSGWLQTGLQHALTPTRAVTFGGGSVFVFHDEPDLEGRLQSSRPAHYVAHHILVHDSRRRDVQAALVAAGCSATARPAFDGWAWLDDVLLSRDAPLLRALGLSAAMPPASEVAAFAGGMRLGRAHHYLCGHEPDVTVPSADARVTVDGDIASLTQASPPVLRLAELGLDPGEHAVEQAGGRLTLRTFAFIRQHAESEAVVRQGRRVGASAWVFADAHEGSSDAPGLAGASAVGVDVREPRLLRRPGAEYLVLGEDGSVSQVEPFRPRWLDRHALDPAGLDVDALTSHIDGAVITLARHPHSGGVVAVRCDGTPRAEGTIKRVPRPDLVAELLISRPQWKWVGEASDGLAKQVLARALRRKAVAPKRRPSEPPHQAVARAGVLEGVRENPFDEVLMWLSERESPSATRADFMVAWAWICDKLGRHDVAGDWRRALQTLSDLGHVEQDFTQGRVFAAPAVAVALPDANGLYLLAGARPSRLVERLDDPGDADPAVADGVVQTSLEIRTAVDKDGRPIAPAAVYIAMEPRYADQVRAAYKALGVKLHGCTSRWLVDTMPSLDRALQAAQHFTHPPGSDSHAYANVQGSWRWVRVLDTDRQGMFRFRQGHRSVFAWRPGPGADLVEVEPAAGRWLTRRAVERTPLIHEHFADRLLVSEDLPLPAVLRRALALRSGMPGYAIQCRLSATQAHLQVRAYENVNAAVAQQIARILGARLHSEYGEVKELDV